MASADFGATQASAPGSQQRYPVAFSVMTTVFFMWGFITCLNDILIPHLKGSFDLSYTQAMLIQFCFFGACRDWRTDFECGCGTELLQLSYHAINPIRWVFGGQIFTARSHRFFEQFYSDYIAVTSTFWHFLDNINFLIRSIWHVCWWDNYRPCRSGNACKS